MKKFGFILMISAGAAATCHVYAGPSPYAAIIGALTGVPFALGMLHGWRSVRHR